MKTKWVLKFLSLSIALSVTLYSIYLLNTKHVPDFLSSLGFNSSTQSFNWCVDRVTKIESLSQQSWSLFEQNGKWMVTRGTSPPAELDYLSVEKWFAQYCTLEVVELKSEKIFDLPMEHFAKISFNNSTTANIQLRGGNKYQINQTVFESTEMTAALAELRALLAITH